MKPFALLLEDRRHYRELMRMWLEDLGYTVADASTYAMAGILWARRVDYGGFALVVADHRVPRCLGRVAEPLGLLFAESLAGEVPLVVTSAEDLAAACKRLGVEFAPKPSTRTDFERAIARALEAAA